MNTAAEIPAIGLGTWQSKPNEVKHAMETALRARYRHIDGAAAHGNEPKVGEGMRASGVPRSEIWLTTQLHNQWHTRVQEAAKSSVRLLGTEYIDLYLIHWPLLTDSMDLKKHLPDWDFVNT